MGLYIAKRITRPVQMLAAAAREIGAGRLDQRVEPQGNDEFGQLVEAFNAMAAELATSRRRVERSTIALERKHLEGEARRRYTETILERIATGVVSIDAAGAITTINSAAARLLSLDASILGQQAQTVFGRGDLQPLAHLLAGAGPRQSEPAAQESRDSARRTGSPPGRRRDGAGGESGVPDGVVLVIDDVTPLIRAQKVAAWREVARRLAHEIKNPLTPIQLSAERMRRHFSPRRRRRQGARRRVHDDDRRRGRVAERSRRRILAVRADALAAHGADRRGQLISDTLALYDGIFSDVSFEKRFAAGLPLVRLDAEQIRRVIINLVDNAVEATNRHGRIVVEAELDTSNSLVHVVVSDDGPGIPPSEREKLFLPYYSTKGRGSGLGLAIVRRIIAEHGGSIDVGDNVPRGTRFTIELPC